MTAASSMDLALATTMSPRRPLGNVSNGAGDIYSNDCVQTEQWWWALDQVAVVADQLVDGRGVAHGAGFSRFGGHADSSVDSTSREARCVCLPPAVHSYA